MNDEAARQGRSDNIATRSPDHIGAANSTFDAEHARRMGQAYGYPSCCVEAFVADVEVWERMGCPEHRWWLYRARDGYVRCRVCWLLERSGRA